MTNEQKPISEFTVKPNPNKEIFTEVSAAVSKNGNYCCCAIEKNADTMCLCKEFRESDESGFCHCGRFFKVRNYPTLTILCAPYDHDHALALAESLTKMGFIVTLPMYQDTMSFAMLMPRYDELQKAKIYHADYVFVCNSCPEAVDFLEDHIIWAQDLNKKIMYEYEEKQTDED
jgi:hypothetical protein